jgi:hypothetical protein
MWFRLVSLVFLFACIWVGVEIYAHGTAGAFGGALSGFAEAHGDARSPLERIQGSATGARDRQLSRIEHQLGGPSVGLRDESSDPED